MKNYSSVLIIYNPNAMRGKIDEFMPKIKQRLLLRYDVVDCMTSPKIDGALELSMKHAGKYDIVVSCGGDGTLHQVVNGIIKSGHNPLIGILPYGTCNDVASTLKIPKNLDKAIDCLLRLNTTKYDLLFDGSNYITYSLATGYLTRSTYSATNNSKRKFGRFAYFLNALKYVFKFKSLPLTVTVDGERIHGKFIYCMLINSEYAGGFRLNKGEDLANERTKLVLIKKTKALGGFINFFKLFFFGVNSIKKSKNVIVMDAKNVVIENHSNAPFTMDGEKLNFLKKELSANYQITFIKK